MPDDLLVRAREQAERLEPRVRAAALLRIARVEAAFDREQARRTFEQGLEETRRIPGNDGQFLLEHAQTVAAAVAPEALREMSFPRRFALHFSSETLGQIMIAHGHIGAAFDYMMRHDEPSGFPFGVAAALIRRFADEGRGLAVLRRAIAWWRLNPDIQCIHFIQLFRTAWKILPPEEARALAREIVRVTLEQPEWPVTATYDPESTIALTSGRQYTLFEVLHILRHTDDELAESLIAEHAQLAAAARRFPMGWETIADEAETRRRNAPKTCGGGFVMGGHPDDFPYFRSVLQASEDGDFERAFRHGLEKYSEDTTPENPNVAPKEFWPSTSRFRHILYAAGKRLGPEAAAFLDRIPDEDLRLFAQIELAAALAGLPELQGTQRGVRSRRAPRRDATV